MINDPLSVKNITNDLEEKVKAKKEANQKSKVEVK